MTSPQQPNRRRFLRQSTSLVAAGSVAPYFVPASALGAPGRPGANDRIGVGFIGTGGRANQLMDHLPEEGQIVAICDVFPQQTAKTLAAKKTDWPVYTEYRKLLERKDVDAVVVATPDHGRVLPCIHACQAGKDIYAEKPLTLSVSEGRVLVNAARKYKRVFQVGSQQRTMEMNRFACELVRSGEIGELKLVQAVNYTGPKRYTGSPEEPVPEGADWNQWQAQTEDRPFSTALLHGWMGWRSYSGGEMTNWGAHGVDQIQWAIGASHSGPVELWPISPGPNGKVGMRYKNGVEVRFELEKGPYGGAIFTGADCKVEINRNKFNTNPKDFVQNPPDPATAQPWEGPGWIARPHMQNWLDCIKSRETPNADVEIGHRSISVCHLANITRELGRKLQWDPEAERFVGDEDADKSLDRPKRAGFELPDLA